MARMTKLQGEIIFFLIVLGLIASGISKLVESVGIQTLLFFFLLIISAFVLVKILSNKKRRAYLMSKYDDKEIVNRLMNKTFWQGQTDDQLLDSLGKPADIDQKVLKTKKKEIWKYGHQGANRYSLRITLENDIVIGWDQK